MCRQIGSPAQRVGGRGRLTRHDFFAIQKDVEESAVGLVDVAPARRLPGEGRGRAAGVVES